MFSFNYFTAPELFDKRLLFDISQAARTPNLTHELAAESRRLIELVEDTRHYNFTQNLQTHLNAYQLELRPMELSGSRSLFYLALRCDLDEWLCMTNWHLGVSALKTYTEQVIAECEHQDEDFIRSNEQSPYETLTQSYQCGHMITIGNDRRQRCAFRVYEQYCIGRMETYWAAARRHYSPIITLNPDAHVSNKDYVDIIQISLFD